MLRIERVALTHPAAQALIDEVQQEYVELLGQREQRRDALAHAPDQVLHRRLPVGGAEQAGAGGGQRLQGLDPHLGGTGAEAPVGGLEVVGNGDRVGHARYLVRRLVVSAT